MLCPKRGHARPRAARGQGQHRRGDRRCNRRSAKVRSQRLDEADQQHRRDDRWQASTLSAACLVVGDDIGTNAAGTGAVGNGNGVVVGSEVAMAVMGDKHQRRQRRARRLTQLGGSAPIHISKFVLLRQRSGWRRDIEYRGERPTSDGRVARRRQPDHRFGVGDRRHLRAQLGRKQAIGCLRLV